jgi:hypothetical protein
MMQHKGTLEQNSSDNDQFTLSTIPNDSVMSDLCESDTVTIPRLYYQLLLENSRHSMLHERHVYSKQLAMNRIENSDQKGIAIIPSKVFRNFRSLEPTTKGYASPLELQFLYRHCRCSFYSSLLDRKCC